MSSCRRDGTRKRRSRVVRLGEDGRIPIFLQRVPLATSTKLLPRHSDKEECYHVNAGSRRRPSSNTTAEGNRRKHHCTVSCTTDGMNSRGYGRSDSSRPMGCCAMRCLRPSMSISTVDSCSTVRHECTATPASTRSWWLSRARNEDCVRRATPNVR